jgi:tetratricopeptide (TPR) repeat protein
MKVPYQLHRLDAAEPVVALLVPGHEPADLLRLLGKLGDDPLPSVYAVAEGFLVKLPQPREVCPPGVIRLRGLAADLLLPADAELVPPLLPDEAAALVKLRGLLFLPGPRVLEYAPDQPLALAALLRIEPLRRLTCHALPTAPRLAEDVSEISLEEPPVAPEELLQPGAEDIGTETPTPAEGNLPRRITGRTLLGMGRSLAWLGQKLGLPGLAGAGARLLNAALALAPGLSEQLMGKQEAVLRDLLRDFREGNIEKALRRALPLEGDALRGATFAQNARLPTHKLFYSLLDLLGSSGRGPASVWFTPGDTYQELLREYRKQAELAARNGDYRRAAFIHARLLNDYRSAAMVLAGGGLHRDAALIFQKKLNDLHAAAREWEAAGEIDRAVALYRKLGELALAGDVLRRAGEEEQAIQEYQLAAAKMVASGARHYEAGELMRTRADRPDLALPYYREGWQRRPTGSPLPCALRLAQHHGEKGEVNALLHLVGEADVFLDPLDAESAGTFYNEVARLAVTAPLAAAADELRDRALTGLTRKMRQLGGHVVQQRHTWSALIGAAGVWPAPLLRDAEFALKEGRTHAPVPTRRLGRTLQVGMSSVTAVCQVPATGDILLGFEDGSVSIYRPQFGEVQMFAQDSGKVLSLATDEAGTHVFVLSQASGTQPRLALLGPNDGFRMLEHCYLNTSERVWICPQLPVNLPNVLALGVGREYHIYRYPGLIRLGSTPSLDEHIPVASCFGIGPWKTCPLVLFSFYERGYVRLWVLGTPSDDVCDSKFNSRSLHSPKEFPWTPQSTPESSLHQSQLCFGFEEKQLMIAGLDEAGHLHQTGVSVEGGLIAGIQHHLKRGGPYRACAVLHSERIAAIHEQGVDWYTRTQKQPKQTRLALPKPVAAFPLAGGAELLIVSADGTLTRLPAAC